MQKELTEDLLLIIGMHEADPSTEVESKQAFDEFYFRFKNHVYKISFVLAKSLNNRNQVAQDLTCDTFINVWQKANRFNPAQCKDVDKGVKAWLSGIVKHTFLQYIDRAKKYSPESVALEKYHLFIEEDVPTDMSIDGIQSLEGRALATALADLKDKERDILITYFQFYDGTRFTVPPDIRKKLCQLHDIQDSTLRKIKDRAIIKLKKYISKNTELLPAQLTAQHG